MPLQSGQVLLGKYRILRIIGEGSFGRAYLADENLTHRKVAVKALRHDLPDSRQQKARERFEREIEIGSQLEHPHIVRMITYERQDDDVYLVLEYMEGGSLREQLDEKGPLQVNEAIRVAMDVCDALAYVHNHQLDLVHRDVTPSNILFTADGTAKLMDFGVMQSPGYTFTRWAGGGREHPGHPFYRAPEARFSEPLRANADVYMLGCVLWEMLTGRTYKHQARGTPPSAFRPEIPVNLDVIVAKALVEKPEDRFQSAVDLRDSLKEGRLILRMPVERPGHDLVSLPSVWDVPSLKIAPGVQSETPWHLPRVSERAWPEAVEAFYDEEGKGGMLDWLNEWIPALIKQHDIPRRKQLEMLVKRARDIRRSGLVDDPIARSAGYVKFLQGIEGFQPPETEIEPQQILDFGDLGVGGTLVVRTITVTNAGGGILEGVIETSHPALGVLEKQLFACKPGESAEAQVSFQPDDSFLGSTPPAMALRIRTNVGQFDLDAHYRVLPPKMKLNSTRLEFSDIEQADPETLTISNEGHSPLTGSAAATVSWLRLEEGVVTLRSRPGGKVQLRAFLVPSHVPAGGTEAPEALVLDTNAGRYAVTVKAPAPPRLRVAPDFLDFGEAGFVCDSIKPKSLVLHVSNSGTGNLDVETSPQVPGLSTSPEAFTCAAGETQECIITLGKYAPLPIKGQAFAFEEGISIESDGGVKIIGGQYTVSWPDPYVFAPGREARTLKEFVALCIDEWSLAVEHFSEGRFEPWLYDEIGCPDLAEQVKESQRSSPNPHEALLYFLEVTGVLDAEQEQEIIEKADKAIAAEKRKKLLEEQADDLTTIQGIGPVMQQRLNEAMIYTFVQLAESTPEELRQVKGGATRVEEWIAQAQELSWHRQRTEISVPPHVYLPLLSPVDCSTKSLGVT